MVDRYIALKEKAKEAQSRAKEELEKLEETILAYAEQNSVSVIVGSEKKVRISERQVTSLPTRTSDPAAYAQVVELLRNVGQWDKVSTLDSRAALKAFESGQLPGPVEKQLEPYVKTEIRKKISISNRKNKE